MMHNDVFRVAEVQGRGGQEERQLVFVCYFDDSYSDKDPNITLGGYYASIENWRMFEMEVEPLFESFGVDLLRGKDIVRGTGSFKDWSLQKKMFFVGLVFTVLAKYAVEGVSSSVDREWFERRKAEGLELFKNVSPLGMAFSSCITSVVSKSPAGSAPWQTGLTVFVEAGHKNNGNLDRIFSRLIGEGFLPINCSLTMIDKRSCRAIQVADMLAFFSRRSINKMNPSDRPAETLTEPIAAMLMQLNHRFNHLWDKPGQDIERDVLNVSDDEFEKTALVVMPKL